MHLFFNEPVTLADFSTISIYPGTSLNTPIYAAANTQAKSVSYKSENTEVGGGF
jgi:hypothetical protein